MKDLHLHKQFYLLLFSLAFITSCHAQTSTRLQKYSTVESKSHPMLVKTQGTRMGNVDCGLQDKSGKLWFGTTGEGVYHYDGESFTNYTTKDGLNSNDIWCVMEDKAGNILFGTGKGISRYDGKSFVDITQNTVLSGSAITTMLEDKTGRLWVNDYKDGYYESAIYLYDPSAEQADGEIFTNFLSGDIVKNDNGLSLLRTNSILEDTAGNIWFAGQNRDGLIYYDGKSLVQYESREEDGLYSNVYRSMIFDKKGDLWLGTHANGVLRSVPAEDRNGKKNLHAGKGSFINITENTGPGNSTIMSMIEDKNGDLWFCTDGEGAWRYDGTSFKNFNTEDGLLNNSVFSVVEDKEGNLWFGTRNVGLYRYDGKSFVKFSE